MKKFFFILLICLLLIGCGKKENVETKEEVKEEEKEPKPVVAIRGSIPGKGQFERKNGLLFFDEDFNLLFIKEIKSTIYAYDIDGDYLYYYDEGLHKFNIYTKEEEIIDIKLEDDQYDMDIEIDGDYLYYQRSIGGQFIKRVNLKTKETTTYDFSKCSNFLVRDGLLYCSYIDFIIYNVDSKEQVKLPIRSMGFNDTDKDTALFKGTDGIYLFNISDNSQRVVYDKEDYKDIISKRRIHLYRNNPYGIIDNKLTDLINKKELYEFKLEENESIYDFMFISDNKVLYSIRNEGEQVVKKMRCELIDIDTGEVKSVSDDMRFSKYGQANIFLFMYVY